MLHGFGARRIYVVLFFKIKDRLPLPSCIEQQLQRFTAKVGNVIEVAPPPPPSSDQTKLKKEEGEGQLHSGSAVILG